MGIVNLQDTRVYLVDPEPGFRRSLRDALRSYGVPTIDEFSALGELKATLKSSPPPDLIVTNAETGDGDVFALVTALRMGAVGDNPFIPVIVLMLNADEGTIRKGVDSGVDYILAGPIAPVDVYKRIETLVKNRKPFVVTSDYIGPDRRQDANRDKGDIPLIAVPNTLRAKSLGQPMDPDDLRAQVHKTISEVNNQRLVRHSYQISLLIEMILPAYRENKVTPTTFGHIQRLVDVSQEVSQRLKVSRFEHVANLCDNLRDVATSISASWEQPKQKDIELLTPLSQAILASFNPERDSAEMAGEITGMLSKFSGRLDAEAQKRVA